MDVSLQPPHNLIPSPEHASAVAKGVEALFRQLLALHNGRLALAVVEEERREAISCAGVDDHASEPPSDARGAHQERVYLADGDGEGIGADRRGVRGGGGRRGNEVCLARRRGGIGQVDLHVGVVCVAEGGLRQPSKQQGGRMFVLGRGGRGAGVGGLGRGLLLDQCYESRNVVLRRGCGMYVDLVQVSRRQPSGVTPLVGCMHAPCSWCTAA